MKNGPANHEGARFNFFSVHVGRSLRLVEKLAAFFGSTVASQFVASIFNRELVVICELLTSVYFSHCKYDYVFLSIDGDDTGVTVGFT